MQPTSWPHVQPIHVSRRVHRPNGGSETYFLLRADRKRQAWPTSDLMLCSTLSIIKKERNISKENVEITKAAITVSRDFGMDRQLSLNKPRLKTIHYTVKEYCWSFLSKQVHLKTFSTNDRRFNRKEISLP